MAAAVCARELGRRTGAWERHTAGAAASGPLRPGGAVASPWSTHLMLFWLVLLLGLMLGPSLL